MISPVSFSGVQGSNFADLVSKPQAYTRTQTPAATGLSQEKGKKGGLKKAGIAVVVVAAALAALGFGAKKGIFINDKIKNETVKKVLSYIDKAGNKITDYAVKAKDAVMSLFKKKSADVAEKGAEMAEKGAEVAETVAEKAAEVVTETVVK